MSRDAALLQWAERNRDPVTLVRFFSWETPTLSLGRNQKAEEAVSMAYCRKTGIPVVKRPTGGRAVFHGEELTYSVVSNDPGAFPLESVQASYRAIALGLQSGLKELGVEVDLAEGERRSFSPSGRRSPCFASTSRSELLVRGRKIVGSAQRRLKRSFLQHGSLPLRVDYPGMSAALQVPPEALRKVLIDLGEALGRPVSFQEAAGALRKGFEGTFGIKLALPAGGQGRAVPPANCVPRSGYAIESSSSRDGHE